MPPGKSKVYAGLSAADIKAIALTARDSDDDYKVGFEAGFDHYLTKPFDFGELRALLLN